METGIIGWVVSLGYSVKENIEMVLCRILSFILVFLKCDPSSACQNDSRLCINDCETRSEVQVIMGPPTEKAFLSQFESGMISSTSHSTDIGTRNPSEKLSSQPSCSLRGPPPPSPQKSFIYDSSSSKTCKQSDFLFGTPESSTADAYFHKTALGTRWRGDPKGSKSRSNSNRVCPPIENLPDPTKDSQECRPSKPKKSNEYSSKELINVINNTTNNFIKLKKIKAVLKNDNQSEEWRKTQKQQDPCPTNE